jgi:sugar lactone lactonase YvrE
VGIRRLRAELLVDAGAELGESPVLDHRDGRLLWVDIPAGALHRMNPVTFDDAPLYVSGSLGVAVPRSVGGYAVAAGRGFGLLSDTGQLTMKVDVVAPRCRMNDGCCAPDGSFWAGSLSEDRLPGAGRLWRWDPDGSVHEILAATVSNGLAFLAPNTFYYIDSPTRRVDLVTISPDTFEVLSRTTVVAIPTGVGNPDGIAVDNEGCFWVALWNGGAVHRYRPDGTLDTVISLPVPNVTNCCFIEQDLVISTAHSEDGGGGLYRCDVQISGPALASYAG